MDAVTVTLRLEVLGKDQVIIPGCEPTSVVTSDTLLRYRRCCAAVVPLSKALEAIPGSRIEFLMNSGIFAGHRKRQFVLPPVEQNCDCLPRPDYYQILRDLACDVAVEEPELEGCEPIDMGYCPPIDYDKELPPPVYPYVEEGNSPYGDITNFTATWPFNVNLE